MLGYGVGMDTSLVYHEFSDSLWVRFSNRGCFINSPALKSIADKYLEQGGTRIVIDMELCPGVDSTFMGTLAGIARRCMAAGGGLEVAAPTARTRAAMESLGLDMLLSIDSAETERPDLEAKRAELTREAEALPAAAPLSEMDRTRHVLEAHNTLRAMNKKNDEAFGYVCETLKEDLERHASENGDDA